MPQFISILSYNPLADYVFEKHEGKSMTIQGESYTINELFERHVKGQLPNVADQSYYEDTQDFDAIDFQALRYADPFDKAELLQDVQAKAKKAYEALEKWKKEQAALDDDDDDDDEPKASSAASKKAAGKKSGKSKSEAKRSTDDAPDDSTDAE